MDDDSLVPRPETGPGNEARMMIAITSPKTAGATCTLEEPL